MAVTGIIYDEGNKSNLGYGGVSISYGDGMKTQKLFNSGNFVKDWFDLNKFIVYELSDVEHFFANSSSVDHFIMDGAPYESRYLKQIDENNWELTTVYGDGIEFFVDEGTNPTWKELKEMFKDTID